MNKTRKRLFILSVIALLSLTLSGCASDREARRQAEMDAMQKKFAWWPTDAQPKPVKDESRSGYWWWPSQPGSAKLWGNRGYVYLNKIIYDYKSEELPPAKPQELRPSLLVKKIITNVKVYFDYDKSSLRDDTVRILEDAVKTLGKNPGANILITGNCDVRGPENYNIRLGQKRAASVKNFMLDNGIVEERIKIISRGKLDAIAPVSDLVGMQKDRNAQFMIAEVEEVMLPTPESAIQGQEPASNIPEDATQVEEGKYIQETEETIEGEIKVNTEEYTVKKGDSLWIIAEKKLGGGHRWKYLYELNKDRIKNPKKLRVGQKIVIPVE
ncbi:MAG: OmpA family protein [Candidatus Omnitrophica bacterium]|nr:OmpA family protein [Candidatus Omnitrophota bacterium]MDD5079568.1 OmpA family protein [Candidatus Omnitrophota bacterium]